MLLEKAGATIPALKAEALHLADRTSEALEAIGEAEALAEKFEGRWWSAELHRLRGVFRGKTRDRHAHQQFFEKLRNSAPPMPL